MTLRDKNDARALRATYGKAELKLQNVQHNYRHFDTVRSMAKCLTWIFILVAICGVTMVIRDVYGAIN